MDKIDKDRSYDSTYSLRSIGGGVSTSVPKKVVERKAKEHGITVEEFIENYAIRMYYDDFESLDGAFEFVKKEDKGG